MKKPNKPKYPDIKFETINICCGICDFDETLSINLKKIIEDNNISINNIRLKVLHYEEHGYYNDRYCTGKLYLEVYSDEDIIKLEQYEKKLEIFNKK